MATPIPLTAGFVVVDTTTAKTFQLPLSTDIVGRSITVKDRTGNAGTNNITIQTQGGDTLQGGGTSYKITQPYGSVTFVSRVGQWLVQGGTEELNVSTINALNVSTGSIQTSTITIVDILNPELNFGIVRNLGGGLEYLSPNVHSFLNQDATNTSQVTAKEYSLFGIGTDTYSYLVTAGNLYTSTISSPIVLVNDLLAKVSPLYLSSVFLGNYGGTVYGELTTDSTASDIYWNGSSLTQGGGSGVTTAQLVSTVQNFQTDFKTEKISSGFIELSTVNLLDTYTSLVNYLTVSSGTLLLNGGFITGSGGSAVSQLIAGSNISLNPPGGTGAVTINNSINPTGLVSTANLSGLLSTGSILGLVSTPNLSNLVSTSFLDTTLVSTVQNLGNFYLSTVPSYLSALKVSTGSLQASTILLFDTANPTTVGIIQYGLSGLQYLTQNVHSFLNENATNTQGISAKELSLFAIGTDTYSYILTAGNLYTSTISSPVLIDGPTGTTAPLYLSSVFLGKYDGTIYGQLTTDSTASDIYWNGSSLTQGGVTTAELVSTTGGLQTNFIGQQATLSSLYLNLDPFNAPFWDSNVPIVGFDPEPNPLALDIYGSVRILKSLYIGSTTTKIGTGGIQTQNLIVSSIQALSEVSTANILASTINLIDVNTAVPQTLAVSSGTLTLNGQGITGGGGGTPTDWALYPALSTVVLDSVSPKIVNPSGTFATFETQSLAIIDSNSNFGSVAVGNINLKTSQNNGEYIFENSQFATGTISTLSLTYVDSIPPFIAQFTTGSLYLSSLYLGNYGGSFAGELTTDDTATNLFWKGTQLNGGGGGVTTGELVSTVVDFQTDFKTLKISSGFIELSTVNLLDTFTSALNYLTVSTGTLLLNGGYITGSGGSAVSQLLAGTNISLTPAGGTGIVTINNTINPTGLVSTPNLNNLVSTSFFDTRLVSTVVNLGSLGYVSTASLLNLVSTGFFDTRLVSTVVNLGSLGYVSTASLTSTVAGLGRTYVSTPSLVSTVAGLGQRYISSFSSFSTSIATLFTASNAIFSSLTATNATMCNITVSTITFNTGDGFIDFPDIRALSMSTFIVNASTINAGFLVSTQVLNVSSIIGVSFITIANVLSTTANLVSTASLVSTVAGLGQAGYVSTPSLVSTYSGIIALGFLSTASLVSTVRGLGQAGYVSTASLVSTYSGIIALGFLSTASLVSTVAGLGQAGYVSTLSNVNNVSANQFVASSIYATLAGPTTLVLYDI